MNMSKRRLAKYVALTGVAVVAFATLVAPAMASVSITGAGATFPGPLYSKWSADYAAWTKGATNVNYVGTGSGAGQTAIKAGTVQFGGSDQPLSMGDLNANSLVQFPTCIGGVVPIINLAGFASGRIKLTGGLLAGIYRGKITTWNNPAIKAVNPGLALPNTKIAVVHRSDSSGTTWIFTNYLKAVDGGWSSAVGAGTSVRWPIGVGGKGNDVVATLVKQRAGGIGYVEYAYALQAHIPYAQMRNKALRYVMPSVSSFSAAAAGAKWSSSNGFGTILVNAAGSNSWPIAGATFALVKKSTANYTTAHAMFQWFDWAYKTPKGRGDASVLQYVSMPTSVISAVEKVWHASVKAGGKAAW